MSENLEADIRAISQIKGLYCDIIDRASRGAEPGDEEKLLALFTEDAEIDFSLLNGTRHKGHEAIRKLYFETFPAGNKWQWHSTHTEVIEVDGDQAIGRWTMFAMVIRKADPETAIQTYGRYIDEFVKVNGVWKQSKIFFFKEHTQA